MHFRSLGLLVIALLGSRVEARVAQSACNVWEPGFGVPGPDAPFDDFVEFDDGTGPALYACGAFRSIGNDRMRDVVRWDGVRWSQVGTGLLDVTALAVFDDGTGPKLVAGGRFNVSEGSPATSIARWDGTSWTALPGAGPSGTGNRVRALAAFDDGSGPALFACGSIQLGGSGPQRSIVRWQNGVWSDVSSGVLVGESPGSFAIFDAGSGPRLYVANRLGSPSALHFWNGTSWSSTTPAFTEALVNDIETVTIGGSTALYIAGNFGYSAGPVLNNVARYDGTSFTPLGTGLVFGHAGLATGEVLAAHDDGSGTRLVVGGWFETAGGVYAPHLASWDGSAWRAVAAPLRMEVEPPFGALTSFDDGAGPALFASGWFGRAGRMPAANAAVLRPGGWQTVASGGSVPGTVRTLRSLEFQGTTSLYVSSELPTLSTPFEVTVARWDDGVWTPLGDPFGTNGSVLDFVTGDLGGGERLYAAGWFSRIGGVDAENVAQWDGQAWSPLGAGLGYSAAALAVFDDGSGPALFAGGYFQTAGGAPASCIARWDGASWSPLGSGLSGGFQPRVLDLAVHDDGSGAALYASGRFYGSGSTQAFGVARWNGASWDGVGNASFAPSPQLGERRRLAVYDDGQGAQLYMSGAIELLNPPLSTTIARWDGATWTSANPVSTSIPSDLVAFRDEAGPKLIAVEETILRAYDGVQWTTIPGSFEGTVSTATEHDGDHDGVPEIFVGGAMRAVDGNASVNMARYSGCPTVAAVVCAGDGTAAACPCGNSGAPGHGCASSVFAGGAQLSSGGIASVVTDTLHLDAAAVTGSDAIFVQGTAVAGGTGVPFQDGLRCTGGVVVRLGSGAITGGNAAFPPLSGPRLSQLGLITMPGETRVYQAVYRNQASFCTSGAANATNGLQVTWSM